MLGFLIREHHAHVEGILGAVHESSAAGCHHRLGRGTLDEVHHEAREALVRRELPVRVVVPEFPLAPLELPLEDVTPTGALRCVERVLKPRIIREGHPLRPRRDGLLEYVALRQVREGAVPGHEVGFREMLPDRLEGLPAHLGTENRFDVGVIPRVAEDGEQVFRAHEGLRRHEELDLALPVEVGEGVGEARVLGHHGEVHEGTRRLALAADDEILSVDRRLDLVGDDELDPSASERLPEDVKLREVEALAVAVEEDELIEAALFDRRPETRPDPRERARARVHGLTDGGKEGRVAHGPPVHRVDLGDPQVSRGVFHEVNLHDERRRRGLQELELPVRPRHLHRDSVLQEIPGLARGQLPLVGDGRDPPEASEALGDRGAQVLELRPRAHGEREDIRGEQETVRFPPSAVPDTRFNDDLFNEPVHGCVLAVSCGNDCRSFPCSSGLYPERCSRHISKYKKPCGGRRVEYK